MIEPRHRSLDRFDRGRFWRCGPAHYDHVKPERTRRGNFAVGGIAAAVLRNNHIDGVRGQQRAIVSLAERPARGNVGHVRQRQRRIDRIDAADQIMMLRRAGEGRDLVTAKRDKNAARFVTDSDHRRAGITHLDPVIALYGGPGRPAQRHERHSDLTRGRCGIGRNDAGIGMRRINQCVDVLLEEVIGKTASTAEPADANRYGLRHGRSRPSGERQRDVETAAFGEAFAEQAPFRCATEDEDTVHD